MSGDPTGTGSGDPDSPVPPRPDAVAEAPSVVPAFVREVVDAADASGAVVGLGGDLDSTLVATLAVSGLGDDAVHGLVLTDDATPDARTYDAHRVARDLGIAHHAIDVQPPVDGLLSALPAPIGPPSPDPTGGSSPPEEGASEVAGTDPVTVEDLAARVRMVLADAVADANDRLLLGPANRTTRLLGGLAKGGDGGGDALPVGDLYATEVRAVASRLGVRDAIVGTGPSVGLRDGRSGDVLDGADLETVDRILYRLVDLDEGIDRVIADSGADPGLVRRLARRHADTRRTRRPPPTPASAGEAATPSYFYDLELRFSDPVDR